MNVYLGELAVLSCKQLDLNTWENTSFQSQGLFTTKSFIAFKFGGLYICMNCELPDIQAGFRKGRGTRDQIANTWWITERSKRVPEKTSTSALLTTPKPLTLWKWKWSHSVMSESLQPHGHQAPLPMRFSKQEYWSGLPFPSPGNLPDSGIEPRSPAL